MVVKIERSAKNHQIQGILEKKFLDFSLTYEKFYKNYLTFPGFPCLFLIAGPFPGFSRPLGTLVVVQSYFNIFVK